MRAKFSCGCSLPIVDGKIIFSKDIEVLNLDCPRTWSMIGVGNTKGVFQLETNLGQGKSAAIRPTSIEELSDLVSVIRPGCISGDTKITRAIYPKQNGSYGYKTVTMRELYNNANLLKYKHLISYDEKSGKLVRNKVIKYIFNGMKPVYKVNFTKYLLTNTICKNQRKDYNLECTDDHPLLTPYGWVLLKDMKPGDRFAVLKYRGGNKPKKHITGAKYFRHICYKNYEYKCVLCDWKSGSLDVNHLSGNRTTNNDSDNLNFFCPNHHRMYSEGNLDNKYVIMEREKYRLPIKEDIQWVSYVGKEPRGETDVYDIQMESPHHNFIAGNIVVHNCMEAFIEGKSLTQHYIDRKANREPVSYLHPILEPILKSTYGILVSQEQGMKICVEVAGFNESEADDFRKAAGKKNPEAMAKIETKFIAMAEQLGRVSVDEAKEIFSWLKATQRYSFNKSHSVAYSLTTYMTAYLKAHIPPVFFTAWLSLADTDMDKSGEIQELVNNARLMYIEPKLPNIDYLNENFALINKEIYYGISDIKGIGHNNYVKLVALCNSHNYKELNWTEFLFKILLHTSSNVSESLILSGALDKFKIPRRQMAYEFDAASQLTDKELWWIEENLIPTSLLDNLQHSVDVPKSGIANIKRKATVRGLIQSLQNPPFELKDTPDYIVKVEESLLSIPITFSNVDAVTNYQANCTCREFANGQGSSVVIAGQIDNFRLYKTKNGQNAGKDMCYLTISDNSGNLSSVTMFSNIYEQYKDLVMIRNTVNVVGIRDKKGEGKSLIVNKLIQI